MCRSGYTTGVVLLLLAWGRGGVTQRVGCCAQCKSGTVFINQVAVRLPCNAPGYVTDPNRPNCNTLCYSQSSGYNLLCTRCSAGYERYLDSCTAACRPCLPGLTSSGGEDEMCRCITPGEVGTGYADAPCTRCVAGKYIDSSEVRCASCSAGKYQDLEIQKSCKNCVGDTWSGDGFSACLTQPTCGPGTFIFHNGDSTAARVCSSCPVGHYQPSSMQFTCLVCPSGKYSSIVGASSCLDIDWCVAGAYATRPGSSSNNVECAACSPGTYSSSKNRDTACLVCPDGKFQRAERMTTCIDHLPCVPGTRTVQSGTKTQPFICANCISPWTTLEGTETSCDYCVAGKYRENFWTQLTSGRACTDCQCGSGEVFINCPVGTLYTSPNMCRFCEGTQPSSYCGRGLEPGGCNGRQTQDVPCRVCPAGKHKPEGSSVKNCYQCPTGKYKASPGEADCTACSNKPSNSVYASWGVLQEASSPCDW